MSSSKVFTNATGAPVADNTNIMTAGPRGPALLQDIWLIEKMAHFDREVIPERRMHAKGWGAYGTFTVTHDITRFTRAKIFSEIGKQTPMFVRFSTVAGERGAADAERDIRGTALKFYTEEGNWDIVGNNTPVFFFRDPLRFPDLNHAIKRDPRTGMRSADNNWDFWTLLPEALHQVTIVMSDRGIPRSFRHMHLFGSHTFSMINAANERVWVKFHFRTQQGIENLTDAEAAALVAKDRESHGRDLLNAIDGGDFPRWTLFIQVMTEAQARTHRHNPFDLTKVWPKAGLSADRGRRDGAEPLSGQLLRRGRAGGVLAGQRRAGHRLLARQDAAGAAVLLRRHAALPARRQLQPYSGQRAEMPVPQLSSRRRRCARTAIWAARSASIPTAPGCGRTSPISPSRRCRWTATAAHWDHRVDDDHWEQPGNLFRMMTPAQQQALFDNTARAMGDAGCTSSSATSPTVCGPIRPTAPGLRRPSDCNARCCGTRRPASPARAARFDIARRRPRPPPFTR